MIISLSEFMNRKNELRKMTVPVELKNLKRNGETYEFAQKSSVSVVLQNLGTRKIHVEVRADLSLKVPCDRCLKEVIVPIAVDFSKDFDLKQSEEQLIEDSDECSYLIGYDFDVDKLICEELLIGFPMKVLCKEDCKGICKVCGADLNESDCGCDRTELDPRMSVIRDIFNNFKEV